MRKLLRIPNRRLKVGFPGWWLAVLTVFVCEMHEERTFAPCRGLEAFFFYVVVYSSLENYFGFRTTNVKGRTDHSVSLRWNNRFEHFQRGEYFSDNCAFELWVDFVSSASQFAFRWAELKPACILLLVVKITFLTCLDFLIYLDAAEPALSLSSAKEPYC